MNAIAHSDMTRPRIEGSAWSCKVVFPVARNVTLAHPDDRQGDELDDENGAREAKPIASPNNSAAKVRCRARCGRGPR